MPQFDYQQIAIAMVVLISSLSFHEAAHAWAADKLGDPTARMLGRLTLNPLAHIDWIGTVLFPIIAMTSGLPLIGWAKPVPVNGNNLKAPRRDFAFVALAGPVSNLVLAAVGVAVWMALGQVGFQTGDVLVAFLWVFISTNVLLAVFNMIPLPPLDGGNVLAGILPEPLARVIDFIRPYGFILLYVLMLTGVLTTIMRPIIRALLLWLP